MFGLVSGSYRPNPAVFDPGLANAENPDGQFANATPADGVYGARVRATVFGFTLDAAFINFTDVLYDIFSLTLPIAAGTSMQAGSTWASRSPPSPSTGSTPSWVSRFPMRRARPSSTSSG